MWIKVSEAAAMLNLSEQAVRTLMRQGKLQIGYVVESEARCEYLISKKLLLEEVERIHGRGGT